MICNHEPDTDSVKPGTGYNYLHEGGQVIELRCKHCGRIGAGLLKSDDIDWDEEETDSEV